jgi:hypothetical protein
VTTGQKLNAIALKYGLTELIAEYKFEEREKWIADAQQWLEERREREAIEAEARRAAGNIRIFRRHP